MTGMGKFARLARERRDEVNVRRRCALNGPHLTQRKSLRIKTVGDEARPHPDPLPQEREWTDGAAGDSYQIKPNKTCGGHGMVDSGQRLVASGRRRKRVAEYSPVKPSQTQSNLREWDARDSGQGLVASGWRRKRVAEYSPVKPSQTQSNLREWGRWGVRSGTRRRSPLPKEGDEMLSDPTESNRFDPGFIIRKTND
jgi:hypothetical protein